MKKYLTLFKLSFQQELAYPINFVMWRIRNVIQIFLIFFLWDTVFSDPNKIAFGYDKAKILTYVFGLVVVRPIVLSAKSFEIAGEISRGELSNYLLKPLSYFKFWFTRDIASKVLNILFAFFEITVLYLILRPPFFFQIQPIYLLAFVMSLVFAIVLYSLLIFLFSMFTFWNLEQAWGFAFLLLLFTDFLGGGIIPLDVLSAPIQKVINVLPFPYLLFMPLQIYLGKLSFAQTGVSLVTSGVWILILFIVVNLVWKKGIKTYKAEGK
ncbi:MAG: ABC-2 family transporter protein [Patescibacteria group bacterium]